MTEHDRQHRMSPDCWCQPVENGIGWTHNDEPHTPSAENRVTNDCDR